YLAQLIEKRDGIEKPDPVFGILILEIKIRTVTGSLHLDARDFRVFGAAHRFRKTDQLALLAADGPIISIASDGDNPLPGVGAIEQHVQPTFKPRTGCQWPGRICLRCFIKQHRNEKIDVVTERIYIDVIQLLSRLNAQPEL